MYLPLSQKFFARSSTKVAKDLIGKLIVHNLDDGATLVARVVETESYGHDDPACHGFSNCQRLKKGLIPKGRSVLLFGPPGYAYVYLNYGVHWLFNVVAEEEGRCGAVLIRAVEPVVGMENLKTNGPGKLSVALAINQRFNGCLLTRPPLYFAEEPITFSKCKPAIKTSGRVGISKAQDKPWRFFEANNPFVSAMR